MKKSLIFYAGVLLLLTTGCEAERQYDNYRIKSIADLTLTQTNHPHGYQKSECFVCHLPDNIHRVDRLGAPSFPLARPLVEQYGLSSCTGCHGNNGVP